VLLLRVFGDGPTTTEAARSLSGFPGTRHVTRTDAGAHDGQSVVTADLETETADAALAALRRLGVTDDDISLLRVEAIRTAGRRPTRASLLWADLLGQASEHARPVARYLVLMGISGMIAANGVIYVNSILIVGAMAVSPDLLPITAIAIALVARRAGLVRRAAVTLAAGLGCAGFSAGVLAGVLDLVDLLPGDFELSAAALRGLTTINSSTFVVALVAGVAGMLALETRASAAVGVAISVTTIPAASYLGVATGVGEFDEALGSLVVLGINVAMLVSGATIALLVQRALGKRASGRAGQADRGVGGGRRAEQPPP
jgi:uncharacterized hydrophobic protein (TIGR00271 family)